MPRRKSERQTTKTTSVKKKRRSSARTSTKKKRRAELITEKEPIARKIQDEVPKKRRRSTKEPKRTKKRAKKTVQTQESALNELQIIELNSELANRGYKTEKAKVSKQVIGLKEKLSALKMEMKEESLRLKTLLEQKVEDETKKDEQITNIRANAESQSKSYEAALNAKEVELERCLGDIKQLQRNLLTCKEEHKKTKTFFEDALKKERETDLELGSKLKKAEDAYREGQINLNKVQSRYEDTQKLLEQYIKRLSIAEKKVKSLGAELKEECHAKTLAESAQTRLCSHVAAFLKNLESESKRVRKLRGENDMVESGVSEQPVPMWNNVKKGISGTSSDDSPVDNMISRLTAALKALNEERSFIISKLKTIQTDTKKGSQSKIDPKEHTLCFLEKQNKQLILEKDGLEEKVMKMSKQLQMLDGKKKIMGMTIREGTKGRLKLRKMLDDTKRAKVKAEAALLTKENQYSKRIQELRSQLAALKAKSKAKQVEANGNHELN